MEKRKPIHEVKVGKVRAAIWANQSANGTYRCVTLGTLYKSGNTWKTSSSINVSDLDDAYKALTAVDHFLEPEPPESLDELRDYPEG